MNKFQKILWLILIILAIGAVAVATRTPNRMARTADGGPSAEPATPADVETSAETPVSAPAEDAEEDSLSDEDPSADEAPDAAVE